MASLDPIFGIHADAMSVQRKRMEVLSANIANADTPGFKARDIDFASALSAAAGPGAGRTPAVASRPLTTHAQHIPLAMTGSGIDSASQLAYRVASQPSVDGNTVDVQVEQAKFADAALHYQASLQFADGKIRSLLTAITGQ
jgi:flagellar basal-body rod protein FlgB